MTKIKMISIYRAEGPSDLCVETRHYDFHSAQVQVIKHAMTAPKNGGYDKHDVTFTWEDGRQWGIRLDVTHPDREDSDNGIEQALRRELGFLAKRWRPDRLTEKQADAILARREPKVLELARSILDECEIGG
jgi:hypothetical protein